ncbi:hypothetical protein RFI_18129 [Reticulomyxa filosa]|uniref:Acyl-CoA dehydrogenase/oxidase N-terminal domain-containing protein n=1 Tax=Reticulomyxa filosa TaxID=46433 RepID=X6MYJ4_RETFI|nr:hypothetical protein RFI_18129 [Reticulomyxa filosa]|eukprot:ETO19110.1 hypothetical protein RFI_18129 [Reticulomyxa filosa]
MQKQSTINHRFYSLFSFGNVIEYNMSLNKISVVMLRRLCRASFPSARKWSNVHRISRFHISTIQRCLCFICFLGCVNKAHSKPKTNKCNKTKKKKLKKKKKRKLGMQKIGLNDDQLSYQELALDFMQKALKPNAKHWEEKSEMDFSVLREAANLGFGGLYIPTAHGGTGLSRHDTTVVFEALSQGCVSTTSLLTIHNMTAWMLSNFGSDELRKKYLPQMLSCEVYFFFFCDLIFLVLMFLLSL